MRSEFCSHKDCFVSSYDQGRELFREACRNARLTVNTEVHPEHPAPDGSPLSLDWAWAGPVDARKVLWMSCGTHGLEAAPGLASILQWFGMDCPLPPDTAVLLVHAINPFGWANHSRCNENGIDLNRNCLDHQHPPSSNTAYEEFHSVIASTGASEEDLTAFLADFGAYAAEKGYGYAVSGVVAGQYAHPEGISYGGSAESWSWQTVKKIAHNKLTNAENIVIIDWHTGIGPFGEPFFILDQNRNSDAFAATSRWYPDHEMNCDSVIGDVDPNYSGLLTNAIADIILEQNNDIKIASMVIEWGTYDVPKMLQALMIDRWVRLNRNHPDQEFLRERTDLLIERFFPRDPTWREQVTHGARTIIENTLEGISSW